MKAIICTAMTIQLESVAGLQSVHKVTCEKFWLTRPDPKIPPCSSRIVYCNCRHSACINTECMHIQAFHGQQHEEQFHRVSVKSASGLRTTKRSCSLANVFVAWICAMIAKAGCRYAKLPPCKRTTTSSSQPGKLQIPMQLVRSGLRDEVAQKRKQGACC